MRIAFQTSQDNAYKVYTMAADGSDRQPVTQGKNDDRHPTWSPDGKMLAFDSGTELKREIAIVDLATGARTQVTNLDAFASFPSWSPDGTRLSFYVYQKGTLDLWTINRDGTKPVQMTQGLASENRSQCTFACHMAAWSPDGSRLAYSDGDQMRVLTMRSDDGTDQVKASVDDPTGRSHFPAYLRDGVSTSGQPTSAASTPVPVASGPQAAGNPVAAAPGSTGGETGILPTGLSPYILALGGLAVVWVLVEGVMIARRRSNKRRGTGSDGQ